jgi:S1-C subfamily serine protease
VISRDAAEELIAQRDQLDVTLRGTTLVAFPGDSPLGKLGFEQGDTIRGVNGMNVSTPAEALGIYTQLKSATRLTIDLDRRGEPLQLTIDIH